MATSKRKLLNLKTEYMKNGYALSFELLSFIRDWVANHLDDSDKAYTAYLKQINFKRD
jgi:hemerythrin